MKSRKALSIDDLSPIDKKLLFSIYMHLKAFSGKARWEKIEYHLDISPAKAERLFNLGIHLGHLEFGTEKKFFDFPIDKFILLTESGKKFLEGNP